MSNRFLKFIPSEEAMFLVKKHPNAFILLTFIAERARRTNGHPDGLTIGQCHIGDHANMGLSRSQYRTALEILIAKRLLEKVETCRTRQKSTTGLTTVGTLVRLCDSRIYDINSSDDSHRLNHRVATGSPPDRHEQEGRRKNKKEKEEEGEGPPPPVVISFPKIKFRELVELTQEQHDSLLAIHGKEFLAHMLDVLDAYKGGNNATYKSDYHVMKKGGWVIDRARKSFKQDTTHEKAFSNTSEANKSNSPVKFVGRVIRGNNTGGREANAS